MAIELEKVTLENRGDTHRIILSKETHTSNKEIIINLNWTQEVSKKGFFANLLSSSQGIDLDLGCFYELRSGEKMVIDGVQFAHNQGGPRDRSRGASQKHHGFGTQVMIVQELETAKTS